MSNIKLFLNNNLIKPASFALFKKGFIELLFRKNWQEVLFLLEQDHSGGKKNKNKIRF